jgi:hypothetical protein
VKLHGTLKLTCELREHGIKLLGSTIIGLEHHTPENIDQEIEHAAAHDTEAREQVPRRRFPPVHAIHAVARHTIVRRDESRRPDARWRRPGGHPRQHQFNFRHAAISRNDSKKFLDGAFRRDFERNRSSIYRICRTTLNGWLRCKNDPDSRVRACFAWEARSLKDGYAAALWARERHLRTIPAVSPKIRDLRMEVERELGLASC